MIGKISSADYGVNFGQGIKPSPKYKGQLASVIKSEYGKADNNPNIRVGLLRAWENFLNWEQKPLEFDLMKVFNDALKNGRWHSFDVRTTFFTRQDYEPRKDVINEVKNALNEDDTLYITSLLKRESSQKAIVPAEYANGRSIQYEASVNNLSALALQDDDDKHYVFTGSINENDERELKDAMMSGLIRESWEKTANELWNKYGAEIQAAAESFNASVQNNDKTGG